MFFFDAVFFQFGFGIDFDELERGDEFHLNFLFDDFISDLSISSVGL